MGVGVPPCVVVFDLFFQIKRFLKKVDLGPFNSVRTVCYIGKIRNFSSQNSTGGQYILSGLHSWLPRQSDRAARKDIVARPTLKSNLQFSNF